MRLAAARSGHTAPLPAGTTIGSLAEMMIRDNIARETAALQRAELYVVSPAMHAAAAAAAATVTEDDLTSLSEDDVPAAAGFVLLPDIQMLQQPGRPHPEEILALLWATRTIEMPHLPARRRRRRPGRRNHPAPRCARWRSWPGSTATDQCRSPTSSTPADSRPRPGHPFPRLMPIHHARVLLDRPPAGANHPLVDEMLDARQSRPAQPERRRRRGRRTPRQRHRRARR